MFDKILIANRGEIAVRIINTCRKLGVKTCAVFSDADRLARHVQMADEAVYIGPSPAAQSYLCGDRILEAAQRTGSQAIHPGYGFLSENAAFADLVESSGKIRFVGPPASAIRSMGSKMESKRIMHQAGVPVTPGYHGVDQSVTRLAAEASKVGFPLMLKADAGGGGKGMRIVRNQGDFPSALQACQREALSSFKDDKVLLERYVERGRHVEVQVFGDEHGNYVSVFERDCSVQRRHQKVFEEAPSLALQAEVRQSMSQAAVSAARAVKYVGAGTVEFLVDVSNSSNTFYFMEMNTRLQVEHPVTEMISGIDLVEWQLRVAAGERLPLKQDEIRARGHALECRVYAENPAHGMFLPGSGPLLYVKEPVPPATNDGARLRVETGFGAGDEVSIYYDPMISKLVVWGADRRQAVRGMVSALQHYRVAGVSTNLDFLYRCVQHPQFNKDDGAGITTQFIPENLEDLVGGGGGDEAGAGVELECVLAMASALRDQNNNAAAAALAPWWGRDSVTCRRVQWIGGGGDDSVAALEFTPSPSPCLTEAHVTLAKSKQRARGTWRRRNSNDDPNEMDIDVELEGGRRFSVTAFWAGNDNVYLFTAGALPRLTYHARFLAADFSPVEGTATHGSSGSSSVAAPMPGKVVQLACQVDDAVEAGQVLLVMEAMKMEHQLKAARAGKVSEIACQPGELVRDGQVLVKLTT